MVNQPPKPSTKALGKRPMRNGVGTTPNSFSALTPSADSAVADEETDDGSLPRSNGGVQTRTNNKRVLPSRMRRGVVGSTVGTSEVDMNILDTLKRKGENDPLIPCRSVFIFTTDSSLVPSASTSEIGLNDIANERYFERPEVIRAYKLQQDIQVPDFIQLDEEMVGGRLRARTGETEAYELSDEAYEKRHRRHEMIEKRQRLREKEKLQHEHYKLKERIEQLRNLDPNSFLTLPSDIFGPSDEVTNYELVDGAASHEAERRRKLMLDVALSLEERYRTLLPPAERKLAEARHTISRTSVSVEPSIPDEDAISVSDVLNQEVANVDNRTKPLKLKLPLRRSTQSTQATPSPSLPPPESSRRRKAASVRTETPPPQELHREDYIAVSSHSTSIRQKRFRQRPTRTSPTVSLPPATAFSASVFTNRVHDAQLNDENQYIVTSPLARHNGLTMGYEEPPPSAPGDGEPSLSGVMARRRRGTTAQEQYPNIIHYKGPTERKPTRKKKQLQYITYNPDLPEHGVDHAAEAPTQPPEGRYVDTNREDTTRVEQPTLELPTREPPTEAMDVDMNEVEEIPPPAWSPAGWEKMPLLPPPEEQSILFAQLRQLAQPDQEGEADVVEQQEVNETPTADEPVTPPVGLEAAGDSIITTKQESFISASALEPINKRRRGRSTPFTHREPSRSLPPELLSEPETLPVISMRSYEIPASAGKGRKPKPLGALLEVSKYNVEPGRKTGRSVKAFGLEVPPFDAAGEIEFGLPISLIREVAGRRKYDNMSVAESDGDPPSFSVGMAHGEASHGMFGEIISTMGR